VNPFAPLFLPERSGEQGIGFVPFYAIAGAGRTAGARGADAAPVRAVARAHGVSAAQVRLAWTLHRGPHVLAIPGTGDPDHLAANVAAGALRLSEDELALLGRLHQGGDGGDGDDRTRPTGTAEAVS
jgi:aryl-alcohol dehydrogenase-like predicted oxidoreductase